MWKMQTFSSFNDKYGLNCKWTNNSEPFLREIKCHRINSNTVAQKSVWVHNWNRQVQILTELEPWLGFGIKFTLKIIHVIVLDLSLDLVSMDSANPDASLTVTTLKKVLLAQFWTHMNFKSTFSAVIAGCNSDQNSPTALLLWHRLVSLREQWQILWFFPNEWLQYAANGCCLRDTKTTAIWFYSVAFSVMARTSNTSTQISHHD